jgi:hypothetical protein
LTNVAERRGGAGQTSTLIARVGGRATRGGVSSYASTSGRITDVTLFANTLGARRAEEAHGVWNTGTRVVGGTAGVHVGQDTGAVNQNVAGSASAASRVRGGFISPTRKAGASGSRPGGELNDDARTLTTIFVGARIVLN